MNLEKCLCLIIYLQILSKLNNALIKVKSIIHIKTAKFECLIKEQYKNWENYVVFAVSKISVDLQKEEEAKSASDCMNL